MGDAFKKLLLPGSSVPGMRADKFLSLHPEITSRTRAAKLIESGAVQYVSGVKILKPSEKLVAEVELLVELPQVSEPTGIAPYDLDLEILFEDEHLLVVNKPAGLVVHPAAGHAQDTLVNALIAKVSGLSMGFGEVRPGIVHRLDKDTSGLLVVAKNDATQVGLVEQFKNKTVHRIYQALVYGSPKAEQGTCQSFLARHPRDRKRFCSEKLNDPERAPKGKWAVTHYKLLNVYACGLSLMQCQLETGRTHQIRVHLSELGHPLLGDLVYGSDKRAKNLKSTNLRTRVGKMRRIGLHAMELGFRHPRTGAELYFKKEWPIDMGEIFEFLQRK